MQDVTGHRPGQPNPLATSRAVGAAGFGTPASPPPAKSSPVSGLELPKHAGGFGSPSAAPASLPSPGSSPRYVPPQRRAAQGQAGSHGPAQLQPGTRAAHGIPPPGFQAGQGGGAPLKGMVGSVLLPGLQQQTGAPQDPATAPQQPLQAQPAPFGSPVARAPVALPPLPPHLVAREAQQMPAAAPGQYTAPPPGQYVSPVQYAVPAPQQEQQAFQHGPPQQYSQPAVQAVFYSQGSTPPWQHPQAAAYYQTPPLAGYSQPASQQATEWQLVAQPLAVGSWIQTPQGWVWQAAGPAPAYQPAPIPTHQAPQVAIAQPGPAAGSQRGSAPSAYNPLYRAPPPHPTAMAAAPGPATPGPPQQAQQQPTVMLAQKLSPEAAAMGVISQAPIPPPLGFAYSQPAPSQVPVSQHSATVGAGSTSTMSSGGSTADARPAPSAAVPSSRHPDGQARGSRLSAAAPAYVPAGPRTPGAGGPARGQQAAPGEEEDYLSGLMDAMGVS